MFPGGVKASQQSGTRGWKPALSSPTFRALQEHPDQLYSCCWSKVLPFHSSQTKAAFLIPCPLKDSFTTGSRSRQDRKEITKGVMDG